MTFQPPPPPPPPGTPPPPPPGQWGPPAGQPGGGGFDPKSVDKLDWGIIGAGVLAFLFSFISYYDGATITVGGHSEDISGGGGASAWHDVFGGGFFGWFAMLFAIIGAAAIALAAFAPHVKLPIANRLLAVYAFGLAAIFEIIAIFVTPSYSYGGFGASGSVDIDHGAGFWISLIAILAGAVLALMRAQQTSTAMPGPLNSIPKIGK